MVPYLKAWNATALPYHFMLLIFIEALCYMGWCDYNNALGFKIPEVHSGKLAHIMPITDCSKRRSRAYVMSFTLTSLFKIPHIRIAIIRYLLGTTTKPGHMPHWCLSFHTWLRCWAQFISQLDDKAGGHGSDESHHYLLMRNGLIALQNTATTLMQASVDQEAAWLPVALFIMGRLYRMCTTLNPTVLAEPVSTMEERVAATRASAVTPKRPHSTPTGPRHGSGSSFTKKPRGNPPGQQRPGGGGKASGPRDGCPYHNFTKQHSLFECNVYKELSRSQNPSSGTSSNQQG